MAPRWPAANATLLELRNPAGTDRYGKTTAAGALVWSGAAEAVLLRESRTEISSGEVTPVERDVLIVRKPAAEVAAGKPGDQATGQTILVRDERVAGAPVETRFRLLHAEHRGRGESDSVRFELIDPRAP